MASQRNDNGPIYLIGGAPRAGKSILGQHVAAQLNIGWVSTDTLFDMLQVKQTPKVEKQWDARPEAISAHAAWFFPCLERFVQSIQSLSTTGKYLIEGVNILPAQVSRLSEQLNIKMVFLGRSRLTLAQFRRFPGRSIGYSFLPEEEQQQIVTDVPKWSRFIEQEARGYGYPYVDMSGDFSHKLSKAEKLLLN